MASRFNWRIPSLLGAALLALNTAGTAQPLPTRELKPQPWLQQLLGSPEWLQLSAGYTSETNGNALGGRFPDATYTHNVAFNASLSSGYGKDDTALTEFDRWQLNSGLSQRSGTSLSEQIPNVLAVQQIYGYGQTFRLAGLWVERNQKSAGLLKFKAGKIASFNDFATSPLYCFYTNNGFCGQIWGVPNSLPVAAYPANQYGAVVHLGSGDGAQLRYGAYQIFPQSFAPWFQGANFQINPKRQGLAQFLQLNVPLARKSSLKLATRINQAAQLELVPANDLEVNYISGLPLPELQLGAWHGRWNFAKVNDDGHSEQENNGIYGLLSVPWRIGNLALDGRLWVNGSLGLNPAVQTIPAFVSGGWLGKGVIRSRPHDTLVIGLARAGWSPDNSSGQSWEAVAELGYQYMLDSNISLQPNLQYVFHPNGTNAVADPLVLGLQLNVSF